MIYKKRSTILIIFFILIINTLLLIHNRQKTSFRYFIWNVEEVSIGRLICISFISGLLMSSLLNKTLKNNIIYSKNESDEKISNENNYSINSEEKNESYEMPPERDLREPQPTISVNYRVIKENSESETINRNKRSQNTQFQDDWSDDNSEW